MRDADVADFAPTDCEMYCEALDGLRKQPKRLPPKLFYDQRGSQLFDQICELPEYYLTRTEISIMEQHAAEMCHAIGREALLVEFGSGSSIKTRLLLDHLENAAGYVPVDISRDHLLNAAASISRRYPDLEVLPVCADFTADFCVPQPAADVARTVVYFPGSTLGNFAPREAEALLSRIADIAGPDGGLLLGIDRDKDPAVLHAAYNDRAGVTAAFNLNMLAHLNHQLGSDFNINQFRHHAYYHPGLKRIEMHLESLVDQTVTIGDDRYHFERGERILTEYSHKFDMSQFAKTARRSGWSIQQVWTDSREYFAVVHLTVDAR